MKTIITGVLLLVTLMAGLTQVFAQTIINNDNTHSRAYLRAGIDPATLITFGYERKVGFPIKGKHPVIFAEWSASTANIKNSELKVGGILSIFEKRSFNIVNNLNLSAGTLSAKNFDSKKFAIADELALGLYKPKWFLALTTEYEKIVLTHLTHSDFYRTTYYQEAKDGWYKSTGGMFQFGIEGGITIKGRYDMHLEIKMPFTERFNSYGGSPLHVNLGLGYRL